MASLHAPKATVLCGEGVGEVKCRHKVSVDPSSEMKLPRHIEFLFSSFFVTTIFHAKNRGILTISKSLTRECFAFEDRRNAPFFSLFQGNDVPRKRFCRQLWSEDFIFALECDLDRRKTLLHQKRPFNSYFWIPEEFFVIPLVGENLRENYFEFSVKEIDLVITKDVR